MSDDGRKPEEEAHLDEREEGGDDEVGPWKAISCDAFIHTLNWIFNVREVD